MKKTFIRIIMMITYVLMYSSCKNNEVIELKQPEFILTTLSSFAIDAGVEFELFTPDNIEGITYHWVLPEQLSLISGQGTNRITVVSDAAGITIPVKNIGVTAERGVQKSYTRWLYKEITILTPPPSLKKYKTKRYGAKTWMIEDLNEAGETGDLGIDYDENTELNGYNPSFSDAFSRRYYTWHEAVTGIPDATSADHNYVWGASGVDDAGNPYVLDGTADNSYNIQIQGACPEGWHIANVNDWYDLLVAIKEEYNVPGNSITEIRQNQDGYLIGWTRSEGIKTGLTLTSWGLVGPYLRGSKSINDGGLWKGSNTFVFSGVNYPLYLDLSDQIEFNLLPGGYWQGAGNKWDLLQELSFHIVPFLRTADDNRPLRISVSNTNVNLSNNILLDGNAACIRCVANY